MAFFDWLSAAAVSFVVSGNTGVSPFCSLFLVGILEKTNPDLLNMDGTIEWILSSWFSIVILGVLMVLEFVGKCIPVVDEIIDSAMTVVVPIFSILGSLSTFGLFTLANSQSGHDAGDDDQGRRALSIASTALWCLQVTVIGVGIVLALCMHGVKMLLRLIGEGWLTYCLTVLETMWVVISIVLAVFIREIAVFIAIVICFAAGFNLKKRFFDKEEQGGEQALYNQMGEEQQPKNHDYRTTTAVLMETTTKVTPTGKVATQETIVATSQV